MGCACSKAEQRPTFLSETGSTSWLYVLGSQPLSVNVRYDMRRCGSPEARLQVVCQCQILKLVVLKLWGQGPRAMLR